VNHRPGVIIYIYHTIIYSLISSGVASVPHILGDLVRSGHVGQEALGNSHDHGRSWFNSMS
jgi:hypothetical protein